MNDGLVGGALEKVNPYYYVGGIVGCIAGYAMAKIYLIWAMMFIEGGYDRFTGDACSRRGKEETHEYGQ